MITFIIPAHNEEALLGHTLSALHKSARALGELGAPYEIIVANDASTDRTGAIALEHGARVVTVNRRQIAATRNAGAREAKGTLFMFVDADTVVTNRLVRAAVRALEGGAVGGGCSIRIDRPLPPYAIVVERLLRLVSPPMGLAAGCFLFCTRRAYQEAGGFNEALYWGEEVDFGQRSKRQGRFVILREFAITSGRKLRAHTALELLRVDARLTLGGPQSRRRGEALEYWYGPREALP